MVPVVEPSEWFPETTAHGLGVHRGWLPVYLELTTRRPGTQYLELEGAVIASTEGRSTQNDFVVRKRVEVSPGAAKKVWLYLHFDTQSEGAGEAQTARLRITSGDKQVFDRQWDIFTISQQRQFVTVPVWTSGENVEFAQFQLGQISRRSAHFDLLHQSVEEVQLPAYPLGYSTCRVLVLVLRDFNELELEQRQVDAIREWVFLGGFVVLVPSSTGEIFSTRLAAALLPEESIGEIRLEEEFAPSDLGVVDKSDPERALDIGVWTDDVEAQPTYFRLDPITTTPDRSIVSLADANEDSLEELVESVQGGETADADFSGLFAGVEKSISLYKEFDYGRGRIGVLAIDDLSCPERRRWLISTRSSRSNRLISRSDEEISTAKTPCLPRFVTFRESSESAITSPFSAPGTIWCSWEFSTGVILTFSSAMVRAKFREPICSSTTNDRSLARQAGTCRQDRQPLHGVR